MKKSVLSIVAIAFAAVSVLSSCDKNDDGYGQSAKTETVSSQSTVKAPRDVEFVVVVEANQAKYIDETYTLDVNGKEMTVDISQMVEISKADSAAYINGLGDSGFLSAFTKYDNPLELKLYKCSLGSYASGSFKVKNVNATVKANYPDTKEMNYIDSAVFVAKVDGKFKNMNLVKESQIYKGVEVKDLDALTEIIKTNKYLSSINF